MVVLREAPERILIDEIEAAADEVGRHLDMYRIGREAEVRTRSDLAICSLAGMIRAPRRRSGGCCWAGAHAPHPAPGRT